ncbi:MAG: glycosyltransferase family 2 protein [Xanthomonadales bacterium]|nr:glycosyltransferase family 2 protein [Xanthomonadales bacterium]
MTGIAVIVVAHDSGPLLAQCVTRVLVDAACREVLVVDNASRDGALDAVAVLDDPRVRIERMGHNAGFAAACNRGAALSASPWLLFLNPDALVEADTLTRLLEIAQRQPDIGLLGADVRDASGQREAAARRRDPTLARLWATQWARLPGGRAWAAHGLELLPRDEALSVVDATSGALMLMPRELFRRIGGFDEGYFLHAEDLDLCRRVRDAGRQVVVANAVPVMHVQGTSSRSRPFFVVWHKHRSLWRYFVKHERLHAWTPRGALLLMMLGARLLLQFGARLIRRR